MAYDVFISYSSKDKEAADAVCAAVESTGLHCWVAPRDIVPGKEWSASIIDAISECRAMVVIFSSHSDQSSQVKREVERAVNKNVAIVPFRIENVFPSGSMEYYLSTTHWLDALTSPLQEHLEYLNQTIKVLLQGSKQSSEAEGQRWDKGIARTGITDFAPGSLTPGSSTPGSSTPGPSTEGSSATGPFEPSSSATSPSNTAPFVPRTEWNTALLSTIENELALHIGPLAKLLIKQALPTVADEAALCRKLSLHLSAPPERQEFIDRCEALTGIRMSAEAPLAAGSEAPQAEWNLQSLAIAEKQLTEHVGPLAKILVKKASRETVNLDDLYHRLAQHIASPEQRMQFLKCERTGPAEVQPAVKTTPQTPAHSRFSLRALRNK